MVFLTFSVFECQNTNYRYEFFQGDEVGEATTQSGHESFDAGPRN